MNRDTVLRLINSLLVGCFVAMPICLYFVFTYAAVDVLHHVILLSASLSAGTLAYHLQGRAP
jgi:hypothetical protein